MSYLYDVNASGVNPCPKNPQSPELQAHSPMREIFIVLNEKGQIKIPRGGGKAYNKGKREKGKEEKQQLLFLKRNKMLGLPPKKLLFKVLSFLLTSK